MVKDKIKLNEMEMIKQVCDIMLEITKYYKHNKTMTIEKFNDICKKYDL